MDQFLHQLRTRSRALAQGLLLVLLATWLSAVCPHCVAQAADAPAMAGHCQHHAPPPVERAAGDHDCCPQAAAPVCDGGSCMQMSNVASVESDAVFATDAPQPAFALDGPFSHAYPAAPPSVPPGVYAVAPDPCPLYLRHCVFRN